MWTAGVLYGQETNDDQPPGRANCLINIWLGGPDDKSTTSPEGILGTPKRHDRFRKTAFHAEFPTLFSLPGHPSSPGTVDAAPNAENRSYISLDTCRRRQKRPMASCLAGSWLPPCPLLLRDWIVSVPLFDTRLWGYTALSRGLWCKMQMVPACGTRWFLIDIGYKMR